MTDDKIHRAVPQIPLRGRCEVVADDMGPYGAACFSDAGNAAGQRLVRHIDRMQAAVRHERLCDQFARQIGHFVGLDNLIGVLGEPKLEQPAAETVHTALV